MGKLNRHDLERFGNGLELTLVEAAMAEFTYVGRNRHSFNRIFLVLADHNGNDFIHNYTTGQHLVMRRGLIYFMPGNIELGFSFTVGLRFLSFHFHLELFGYLNIFRHQTTCSAQPDKNSFADRLTTIIETTGWRPDSLCNLRGIVLQLAGDFFAVSSDDNEMDRLNDLNDRYGELFEYIRHHGNAQTSVDELAALAGVSRDALSRAFSHDCGLTLKQYLNQALTQKAERLLLAPGATARNVADKLCFNNEYYFSRFFRKNTGTTTRDYRAQILMDSQ